MKAKTRMFGEIDIQEDKIITLESGMIGFPDMQKFTLIFDEEKGSKSHIMWLQSMDDPQTAFPVINPVTIKEDYNPSVSEVMTASHSYTNEGEAEYVVAFYEYLRLAGYPAEKITILCA